MDNEKEEIIVTETKTDEVDAPLGSEAESEADAAKLLAGQYKLAYEDALRELEALKRELAEAEAKRAEEAEFDRLFPGVSRETIPEEVISSNLPLAAAYALYLRELAIREESADIVNEKNRERSTGAIKGGSADEGLFSLSEIRSMSANDVRLNYGRIIKSLSKKAK